MNIHYKHFYGLEHSMNIHTNTLWTFLLTFIRHLYENTYEHLDELEKYCLEYSNEDLDEQLYELLDDKHL